MGCNPSTELKNKHIDNMDSLWVKWSNSPSIANRYRNPDGTLNVQLAKDRLVDFAQFKLNLPFSEDYVLSKGEIKRVAVEIDAYSKDLKGNFSEILGIVPEGISKQDPTTRKFYTQLNNVLNEARVNTGKKENAMAEITAHFLDAYVNAGKQNKYFSVGIKAVNELRKLRKGAMEATTGNERARYERQIDVLVKGDEGFFLRQFKMLSDMSRDNFKEIRKNTEYRDPSTDKTEVFDPHVIEAATAARNYLDSQGNVFIRGLQKSKDVIDLKYKHDTQNSTRLKKDIDAAIENIQASMKQGGYWPGTFLNGLVEVKTKMDNIMSSQQRGGLSQKADLLSSALKQVPLIPDHAKGRNPNLNHVWDQDPLFVLGQYGKDAVSFNKLVHAQEALMRGLSELPKTNNTKFIQGMKKFMTEEYAVFTEGTKSRPDWVNNMVYYANAFQTARTMGFNITGAVKNAASAVHYFSHVGPMSVMNTSRAIRHNEKGVREILDRLEDKAGYKFVDPASELFAEGLIKKADFEASQIEFNPLTGSIKYNGTPMRDAIGQVGQWTMGKLLMFHRITENWQRRWMFRTAFTDKYFQLMNSSPSYSQSKAEAFAKNHALNMVNGFAYEYAPHAKAKPLRGTGHEYQVDKLGDQVIVKRPVLGGLSEVAFHLLHYPMSLAETHLSNFKGAGRALKAGQLNADEVLYAARYAGVYGVLQLGSILLNTDLNNLFENETISRINRIHNDLTIGGELELSDYIITDYSSDTDNLRSKIKFPQDLMAGKGRDKSTFGLSAEVFGPTLGHIKYGLINSGIIDLDSSTFNKVVFGNVDYSDKDESTARYEAYQLSTEYGRFVNKTWPALRDGRGMDLVRHWLALYPRKWTKEYHESIFGKKEDKMRLKGLKPEVKEAVNILDQMLESGAGYAQF